MSADFETAIAFGATYVRVGSQIFGDARVDSAWSRCSIDNPRHARLSFWRAPRLPKSGC